MTFELPLNGGTMGSVAEAGMTRPSRLCQIASLPRPVGVPDFNGLLIVPVGCCGAVAGVAEAGFTSVLCGAGAIEADLGFDCREFVGESADAGSPGFGAVGSFFRGATVVSGVFPLRKSPSEMISDDSEAVGSGCRGVT